MISMRWGLISGTTVYTPHTDEVQSHTFSEAFNEVLSGFSIGRLAKSAYLMSVGVVFLRLCADYK
jgi:hypothetical protein